MYVLEDYKPKRGLSVPSITVLDREGRVLEQEQRRVFRYNVQDGFGADIVFGVGTTGEWDRISNEQRQQIMRVQVDEVQAINEELVRRGHARVQAWVGVTGRTQEETLSNIEVAIKLGADAGVLAPLAIRDLGDVVRFFQRCVADLMDREGRRMPLFLYDNAEIAADPHAPHIRTRIVKQLSRLDFVRGVKVSAPKRVLGNYIKASLNFKDRGEFGIYIGNAMLMFDIFRPKSGLLGKAIERWNRYWLHHDLPVGVVSGPANVLPREWQKAWQVCLSGDSEMMEVYRRAFQDFENACRFVERGRIVSKHIACFKYALYLEGVISSCSVARGTPELTLEQMRAFAERYRRIKDYLAENSGPLWVSSAHAEAKRWGSGLTS